MSSTTATIVATTTTGLSTGMTTWLVVAGAALVTYLIRISMVVVFHQRELPASVEPVLSLATPAVLAGVVAGALFLPGGEPGLPPIGHLLALGAAVVVVRRTGKTVLALAAGVPVAAFAALVGLA